MEKWQLCTSHTHFTCFQGFEWITGFLKDYLWWTASMCACFFLFIPSWEFNFQRKLFQLLSSSRPLSHMQLRDDIDPFSNVDLVQSACAVCVLQVKTSVCAAESCQKFTPPHSWVTAQPYLSSNRRPQSSNTTRGLKSEITTHLAKYSALHNNWHPAINQAKAGCKCRWKRSKNNIGDLVKQQGSKNSRRVYPRLTEKNEPRCIVT